MTPRLAAVVALAVALAVLVLVIVPVSIVGAAALLSAAVLLSGLWFWWWYVLTARANNHLLQRPELGDFRRVLALSLVFFGYPLVFLVVVVAASLLQHS